MSEPIFSNAEYEAAMAETFESIKRLGKLKGGEYSGDVDRLLNFREDARSLGIPQELSLMVFAEKHWNALRTYTRDLISGKQRERLEPITGRIDDLILYLVLFKCMHIERNNVQ